MNRTETPPEFDPSQLDILADPYPVLNAWRERDPVHWNPILKRWMILKHDDFMKMCRHPQASSNSRGAKKMPGWLRFLLRPLLEGVTQSILFLDEPDHGRLRSTVNKIFLPRLVAAMQPRIEDLTHELLSEAHGRVDLMTTLAFPLPVIVISELLGVDVNDRALFKKWSNRITKIVVKPDVTLVDLLVANQSVREMRRYFNAEFHKRRASPREDLISKFLKEAGDAMTDAEIFSMCMLILIAGHETTTNLIGNGILALLKNPEQLALLRREPERIDAAVEEILRYDSSVQAIVRMATDDIELRDKVIGKGQMMMLSVAAANRDPEAFTNPDRFDIERTSDTGHASFGKGAHFCLGSALARLETKIAILLLIQKYPELKLEAQTLDWRPALSHRGLKTLWVDLGESI